MDPYSGGYPADVVDANHHLISAAADDASADADLAADSAAATIDAALVAAQAARAATRAARQTAAVATAATAAIAAEDAVRNAALVEAVAAARTVEVAASAVEELEEVAAHVAFGADPEEVERTARAMAATVAADAAVLKAGDAAQRVARQAADAEIAVEAVVESSELTVTATGLVVESTRRVAGLAARLKVVAALRDSEQRFRVTFEHAPLGMMLVSLAHRDAGSIMRVNPALSALTGRTTNELKGLDASELFHVDDRAAHLKAFAALVSAETQNYEAEARWGHTGSREIWVKTTLHAIRHDEGQPPYCLCQVEDITERLRATAALRQREERFRVAFDTAVTPMLFLDTNGTIRKVNAAMETLLGYDDAVLRGIAFTTLASVEDRADIHSGTRELVSGDASNCQSEHRFVRANGTVVWALLSASLVENEEGAADYLVFQLKDVSARKHAETKLAYQALHDNLTGLPNRALLADHLTQACARAERSSTLVAVLFLDLDDFKQINDSLGHDAGDHVLVEVAGRLRGALRGPDTAARLGSDEFVIVCEGLAHADESTLIVERVNDALSSAITLRTANVHVTVSIGVITSEQGAQAEFLLRGADTAMYAAKANGKDRYELYDSAMSVSAERYVTVASELALGLEREELLLHYQPVYDMRTGHITSVEALIRWQHPTRGLLPPADFLDVAEGRRLMVPIGDWVLRLATAQAARWQVTFGDRAPDVWVNISGQQLGKEHLIYVLADIAAETGVLMAKLGVEITERELVGRSEAVAADLASLRELGMRIAIDDFGTGYASLEYLRRFPVDEIKIDQSFVSGLGVDRTDTAVTSSIITLGRSLDLAVVGEGVETPSQYRALAALGCDFAQGYLMQRPMSVEGIDAVLAANEQFIALE